MPPTSQHDHPFLPDTDPSHADGSAPIPLSGEQVRQFIADGYLLLRPSLPDELHESIRRRLDQAVPVREGRAGNPGNNILPLVPEMRHVLRSPEVHGALQTLLGPDYLEHPHRFCHVEERPADSGADPGGPERLAKMAANCHQDSYTPLARPRHHLVRYARVMYYPQETPERLGPTHVIPGTHLNTALSDAERTRTIPVAGPAGTVSITHFDVGHAAGINRSGQRRFMVKFIYQRASPPAADGWSGAEHRWRDPQRYGGARQSLAWSHLWDWLRGAGDRYASLRGGALPHAGRPDDGNAGSAARALADDRPCAERVAAAEALAVLGTGAAPAVPALLGVLNRQPDPVRVAAAYALGAIGAPAVGPLIDALRGRGGAAPVLGSRLAASGRSGPPETALPLDDAAFALAAAGAAALPALQELLRGGDEWARLNAAFALGEMDRQAQAAVPALIAALDDPSHLVVRAAADALGAIGAPEAAAPLGALFRVSRPGWEEEAMRGWTARDQVRVNAATALARLGRRAAAAEDDLRRALDDRCGQVAAYAVEALRRIGSSSALAAALGLLAAERWDPSITPANGF